MFSFCGSLYRKLSQVHAGVNQAFFKADGRILRDFFNANTQLFERALLPGEEAFWLALLA